MQIGIIGAGTLGGYLARKWASAGHKICLAARCHEKLRTRLAESGESVQCASVFEAVCFGEIVLLAVPFAEIESVLTAAGDALREKIVVDATNPTGQQSDWQRKSRCFSGTSYLAKKLPDAYLVKAFNALPVKVLREKADITLPLTERTVVFYCGDHWAAKRKTADLIRASGLIGTDTGSLRRAAQQEPGGKLYGQTLTFLPAQKLVFSETNKRTNANYLL
jgi:8-hydroxy-5-deazaflavin:NADPH oxidoreductase